MYILTVHVHVIVIRNFVFTTFFNEHCVQRHSHRNTCRLNRRLKEQYVAGDKSNRNARLLALNFKKNHRHGKPPSLLKCSFSEVKRNYVQEENTSNYKYVYCIFLWSSSTHVRWISNIFPEGATCKFKVQHNNNWSVFYLLVSRPWFYYNACIFYNYTYRGILAGENGMMKWSATISRK